MDCERALVKTPPALLSVAKRCWPAGDSPRLWRGYRPARRRRARPWPRRRGSVSSSMPRSGRYRGKPTPDAALCGDTPAASYHHHELQCHYAAGCPASDALVRTVASEHRLKPMHGMPRGLRLLACEITRCQAQMNAPRRADTLPRTREASTKAANMRIPSGGNSGDPRFADVPQWMQAWVALPVRARAAARGARPLRSRSHFSLPNSPTRSRAAHPGRPGACGARWRATERARRCVQARGARRRAAAAVRRRDAGQSPTRLGQRLWLPGPRACAGAHETCIAVPRAVARHGQLPVSAAARSQRIPRRRGSPVASAA